MNKIVFCLEIVLVCIFKNTTSVLYFNSVDEVPPYHIGCPRDISDTVAIGQPGKTITWEEPSSNDNSGVSTIKSKTHNPGSFFQVGSTTVTYVFADEADNTAECVFDVVISEGKRGTLCFLACSSCRI